SPEIHDQGLCSPVNAVGGEAFTRDNGRVQDNGSTIGHKRKRLLHGEKKSLYVCVEDGVVEFFSNRTKRRISRNSCVREHNIQPPFLLFDLREKAIEIANAGHVPLDGGYIFSNLP